MLATESRASGAVVQCPSCAWTGPRTARGPIPAHKVIRLAGPGDRLASRHRGAAPVGPRPACAGPMADRQIARAIARTFAAVRMPDAARLSTTLPPDLWASSALYRALAPMPWARYVVTVLAPLDHDGARRTVVQAFHVRAHAEAWAHACALALGPAGGSARTLGYVTVGALDTRRKRWETMARYHGRDLGLESPVTYTAIDPGGVVVRYTDPAHYPGHGDAPSRDAWDRIW